MKEPEVGSRYVRKSDGLLVEVVDYDSGWEDVQWQQVDGKKHGKSFLSYFGKRYELVSNEPD